MLKSKPGIETNMTKTKDWLSIFSEKMMRNNKLLLAATVAALSTGLYSAAISAASTTANASANVITPIGIVEDTALNFGDVAVGAAGGDVILASGGGRTVTGDAEAILGGSDTAGQFTITGEGNKAYTLLFPATVDISGGTGTMNVTGFINTSLGTIPVTGTETFNIGATLTIGASQPGGLYSNTYVVTVDYQ